MILDSPKTLGREDFLRLFAEVDQILVSNNPLGDAIKAAVCGGAACLLQRVCAFTLAHHSLPISS